MICGHMEALWIYIYDCRLALATLVSLPQLYSRDALIRHFACTIIAREIITIYDYPNYNGTNKFLTYYQYLAYSSTRPVHVGA